MRDCGGCTLCCEVTRVPELDKPELELCVHCDNGCSIYSNRPQSCRDFQCAWSMGDMAENMRPDIVEFMVEVMPDKSVVFVTATDRQLLIDHEDVFAEYLDRGVSVIASNGFGLIAEGASVESVKSSVLSSAKSMGVIK